MLSTGEPTRSIESLTTDRSDASGTGYWSSLTGEYLPELIERAFGRVVSVPRVLGPVESPGRRGDVVFGPGAGDNAAGRARARTDAGRRHRLGGDLRRHIGQLRGRWYPTAPARSPVSPTPRASSCHWSAPSMPLACSRPSPRLLGVDQQAFSELALSAPAGADGLVLLPYLEGERTPNLPDATGELHGLRHKTSTPAHLARAAVEGVLCGLAEALDAVESHGVTIERLHLIGGGARSEALRRIAPGVFGRPVLVPPSGEYVADGAAYPGEVGARPRPQATALGPNEGPKLFEAEASPFVRERYAEVRDGYVARARREGS